MRESGEKIGRELATAHRPDTKTTENPSASPILQQPMPGGKPGVVCWRRRSILETPMTISTLDRGRLTKLLGVLGSDQDGEVAAAGRAADQLRRKTGKTWHDIISPAL